MLKHPEELGFTLGLVVRIDEPASIVERTAQASHVCDVVYVALPKESGRPLKKGDALKVGLSGKTLLDRWKGIVGIFKSEKRPNEMEDRRKWLEAARGKDVCVWMRAAGQTEISYAKGLAGSKFSTRGAEEEFLDQYYEPRLGKQLNRTHGKPS